MKRCPYCAEEIQDEAILCKHCHSSLPPPPPHPGASPTAATVPPKRKLHPVLANLLFWVILVLVGWVIWEWSARR